MENSQKPRFHMQHRNSLANLSPPAASPELECVVSNNNNNNTDSLYQMRDILYIGEPV